MARQDPYRNFRFLIEIDGITQAGFNDCSGFGSTTDPIEYREGGEPSYTRKLPGQTKYNNVVLKWGLTDNRELFDWYTQIVKGQVVRKNGSIILQDTEGSEKIRWNFFDAWPTKYSAPELTAKGNDVAIDTVELAVERLERAK
jgi:phage tail-like protein